MYPGISVIIPAYNAAATIAETIESVLAQTSPCWEAIIIDDGSDDATSAIVNKYAENDTRVKIYHQHNQGLSAARNAGIDKANYEWLLFLDADDWITPCYIDKALNTISRNVNVDVVHCGWVRVAPDGSRLKEKYAPDLPDMFPLLAYMCPFAVHACVIKKSVIEKAGHFDSEIKIGEDWDFWQRVARAGSKFKGIQEVMALYRMRPDSLSSNGDKFYSYALKILIQGHYKDSRVTSPAIQYEEGISTSDLSARKLYLTSWFAGLIIGKEKDATHLLDHCKNDICPDLDSLTVAENIVEAVVIAGAASAGSWLLIWQRVEKLIREFIIVLEMHAAEGFSSSVFIHLERLILQQTPFDNPVIIGATKGIKIIATEPIKNIDIEKNIDRLFCKVEIDEDILGDIEITIKEKFIAGSIIKDAVAAKYSWIILQYFFATNVYPYLSVPIEDSISNFHDTTGWKIFLQQLWGITGWESNRFYDPSFHLKDTKKLITVDCLPNIEVSDNLVNYRLLTDNLCTTYSIAGKPMSGIIIERENDIVSVQAQRAAITSAGGYELCRISVREALFEIPLNNDRTLRQRLSEAARQNKNQILFQ